MSDNKNKYWSIETNMVVSAPTKAEALVAATSPRNRRNVGTVLATQTFVDRIAAADAHTLVASAS